VPVTRKGKRIIVELTGDEVADLHNDAVHYSASGDFDFDGAFALASSARATRKAIEAQVPNLAELDEQWAANAEAARQAWLASDEYKAEMARLDEWKATQARLREEARQRDIDDPMVTDLTGRRVRHEQTGGEWATVRRSWFRSGHYDIETNIRHLFIEGGFNARASDLGIEVAPLD
jgi:hypothetical protein